MSLEDAVHRLANVIGTQTNAAVAEIIRQRDVFQKRAEQLERDSEFYRKRRDDLYDQGQHKGRQIAALRGVIKRMKKQETA